MEGVEDEDLGGNAEAMLRSEPDIKKYIRHLKVRSSQKRIENIRADLRANQNEGQQIRAEIASVEARSSEGSSEIMNATLDTLERLNQEFRKLQHEEKDEDTFLKQQLGALNQDKTKLEQSVLLLSTRVAESETQIGIELRLPEVEEV